MARKKLAPQAAQRLWTAIQALATATSERDLEYSSFISERDGLGGASRSYLDVANAELGHAEVEMLDAFVEATGWLPERAKPSPAAPVPTWMLSEPGGERVINATALPQGLIEIARERIRGMASLAPHEALLMAVVEDSDLATLTSVFSGTDRTVLAWAQRQKDMAVTFLNALGEKV